MLGTSSQSALIVIADENGESLSTVFFETRALLSEMRPMGLKDFCWRWRFRTLSFLTFSYPI